MRERISILSRIILGVAAFALLYSITVPIWRIELDAPQYPEGLVLQIYAARLGGDVEIINGLNHYIGMGTLHTENFIEFTVLPYILGAYALLMIVAAAWGRKKLLYGTLIAFFLFGIIAMVDFYRWEYNYGHNLDPHAAIIVPGMAYQPPLIGFKQLLNFGAYSIPDTGGWLILAAGILTLTAVLFEWKPWQRFRKAKQTGAAALLFAGITVFVSCTSAGPQPIRLNADKCASCQMTISDGRFAAEFISEKGRAYMFDDIYCMLLHEQQNPGIKVNRFYVSDYLQPGHLTAAGTAFFIKSENMRSPMGGNTAAFATREQAAATGEKWKIQPVGWNEIHK